jgi:hypothetical protein
MPRRTRSQLLGKRAQRDADERRDALRELQRELTATQQRPSTSGRPV